jgi:hypothetical protein
MRSRLPLVLLALTFLFALVASGCGDDKSSGGTVNTTGATQSTVQPATGGTGSSGSASASIKQAYQACLDGAEKIPDGAKSREMTKRCKDSYSNVKDASAKIDQAASDARAKCEEAANKIPDETTKASALESCAKFN